MKRYSSHHEAEIGGKPWTRREFLKTGAAAASAAPPICAPGAFGAKNVKVITRDGKVTLRGVVESDVERNGIISIAKKHAGASPVSDQLSVKAKK